MSNRDYNLHIKDIADKSPVSGRVTAGQCKLQTIHQLDTGSGYAMKNKTDRFSNIKYKGTITSSFLYYNFVCLLIYIIGY